jgi:hypothetical protein
MKKGATPKRKGLKRKTSDEKRGNPKMQGAQKRKRDLLFLVQTTKSHEGDPSNQKSKNY